MSGTKAPYGLPAYAGGKVTIARRIVRALPPARWEQIYIEPYAGMLSVLLSRPPVKIEIVNDINERLVNFWTVVRDEPEHLEHLLHNSPRSRKDFEICCETLDDPALPDVERARRLVVVLKQSVRHTDVTAHKSAWRKDSLAKATNDTYTKTGRVHGEDNIRPRGVDVRALANRLRDVIIENKPAEQLIARHVRSEFVIAYLDPPYRSRPQAWYHADAKTTALIEILRESQASVAISGYDDCPWDALEWRKILLGTVHTRNRNKKEEYLWVNY